MQKKNSDEWFTVIRDLDIKKFNEPLKKNEQILYLVKKTFAPQDDLLWYDYELFDSEMETTRLIFGNFTCIKMYEIVPKDSKDVYWFGFSIFDKNGVTRKNELMCDGEKGIIEVIKLMRKAAEFGSWASYDVAARRLGGRLYD